MKIVMVKSAKGASRSDGATTQSFNVGQEYTAEPWQVEMFKGFVNSGLAHEVGGNEPVAETKETPTKKGRPRKSEL